MTKKFEMSMIRELTYFLGLKIKQDDKGISICQEQYTRNLLKKYEISNSSSVKTLMVPPNNIGLDLTGKPINETLYRGMIGSLMYLTATRPDIQFFIVLCARYQSNPKESHLIAMKRILRYLKDTMADAEHAPAMAPPVRTDEQILPRIRWVPIGKSNCYLNEEKSQPSPIFKIAVDILKQTNFFRAFTASSTIPAIYIQQFWDTICFDSKAGSYKCQLDEQWFDLTQDTLRDALQITPVDKNRAFSPPPTPDTLIEFVNELGYPREVINLSNVTTNDMFQPWRALTTIINLCLTGKTSEFTQSIHNFTEDKRNLAQQAQGKKKATIILIPSIRFTKLIIFHLQRLHNFHPRPESPLHLPTEEPVLGNLKFSAKGTKREVFGMTIPNELINDVIRGAVYDAYLKKVAKHQRYLAGEEVSDPDSPAPKPAKPAKQTKPKPTKQSKPTEPKAASKKPNQRTAKP
ncbi:hypothetical protein Tco_1030886 [Tanacetum coccineum]|uniref:Reverse transcriptase Ty1/copia-type domain-containing protein n=1 Tax=Tanacetum coccineum TaxID=301880 RepID=A0ABQ5G7G5_9ASTR